MCNSPGLLVGIGATVEGLQLDGTELERTTAGGIVIGGGQCGSQSVGDLPAARSQNINGVLTFQASRAGSKITFLNGPSDFSGLGAQAYSGIVITIGLIT